MSSWWPRLLFAGNTGNASPCPSSSPSPPRTPHGSSTAKRKRGASDSTPTPFAPRLRTDLVVPSNHADEMGSDSPRAMVANRFSDLRLRGGPLDDDCGDDVQSCPDSEPEEEIARRRSRMSRLADEIVVDSSEVRNASAEGVGKSNRQIVSTWSRATERQWLPGTPPRDDTIDEIPATPETPNTLEIGGPQKLQEQINSQMLSPPGSVPRNSRYPSETITVVSIPMTRSTASPPGKSTSLPGKTEIRSRKQPKPSPPKKQKLAPAPDNVGADTISVVHKPPKKETKTSAERTDVDTSNQTLDPDDDGTGLNGVGFKPTPAVAWARSQKRKQQMQEWRARENCEARQKRRNRRDLVPSAGAAMDAPGVVKVKRTVRLLDDPTQVFTFQVDEGLGIVEESANG